MTSLVTNGNTSRPSLEKPVKYPVTNPDLNKPQGLFEFRIAILDARISATYPNVYNCGFIHVLGFLFSYCENGPRMMRAGWNRTSKQIL
ncbi:MAG: hypothetical protein HOE30_15590 [Deltaproteobacteria bacterium]|jgi:hypothetical protein|nr:hypothetical protein [Deltaproteobacteria bacterium]MBT4089907.1 hypothetical protein [Deltaproteobacteria bacterium]